VPGRFQLEGSRETQSVSASKSKVNMTAHCAPLGQGLVCGINFSPWFFGSSDRGFDQAT
jgi:hypothetical protein